MYGNLMGLLTIMKGLPLTYNKDLQEDKEGMFDTVKTIAGSLQIFTGMIQTMTVNEDVMKKRQQKKISQTQQKWQTTLRKKACHSVKHTKSLASLCIHVFKKASI
ncbi:hypothetical protein BsIDN1_51400 [Bacillus safensis]|uniref:Argininosuccinate lyase n=1 Tax=Bacillus safensis TaxID=561879 RepID=A0A5S9MFX0_BACIA|nr:hypothetical protein BsIDN1_51400 [Bacillus safensis]